MPGPQAGSYMMHDRPEIVDQVIFKGDRSEYEVRQERDQYPRTDQKHFQGRASVGANPPRRQRGDNSHGQMGSSCVDAGHSNDPDSLTSGAPAALNRKIAY